MDILGKSDIEGIAKGRMAICRKCPLYKKEYFINAKCNGNLYLNPETNDVSTTPKEGYVKGCSCYLNYKVNNIEESCPAKKW